MVSGCTAVVQLVSTNKSKECQLSSRNVGSAGGLRDKATVVSQDRRGEERSTGTGCGRDCLVTNQIRGVCTV
jgi:hypothetical protein